MNGWAVLILLGYFVSVIVATRIAAETSDGEDQPMNWVIGVFWPIMLGAGICALVWYFVLVPLTTPRRVRMKKRLAKAQVNVESLEKIRRWEEFHLAEARKRAKEMGLPWPDDPEGDRP